MKIISSFLVLCFTLSTLAFATERGDLNSRTSADVLSLLIEHAPELTIENEGGVEHLEMRLLPVLSDLIINSSSIKGECAFRGKSAIEDCVLSVTEKNEEGEHQVTSHSIYFTSMRGVIRGNVEIITGIE